ncbi:DUF58 domain-containing protein [Limisphaera sp. VF-2]|jgi:uncharacterized protein (DUF58 family)|uniref:DUF58 domain-containing protein n=1 Tax=Limisphaera sp. VF-2 TaxID=3400418 RepID=UPI001768C853|nr:DUF58 domain-containing protein [Limisphaera sp.]
MGWRTRRLQGGQSGPHRFRRWLRLRFTPTGLALLVAMLLSGTLGFDPDNSVAYQAFTLLFGVLLASATAAGWMRGRFEVERVLPRFVTAGVPFRYRVRVRNRTRRTQQGLTVLEELVGPVPGAQERGGRLRQWWGRLRRTLRTKRPLRTPALMPLLCQAPLPVLAPNQIGEATLEAVVWRRGLLELREVLVARTDPFGLVRVFRRVPAPQKLVVLPRRYFVPPLALPGLPRYQLGGVALASQVGQSDEFISLRDYRRGDPIRHIHWRSWAKVGRPIVREFEDEFFVRHALVLDTFMPWEHHEAFEAAVSVAASLACSLPLQESLLDLLFVGPDAYCVTAGRGVGHVDQILEILAAVRPCHHRPFHALEQVVLEHAPLVSGCLCILLGWDGVRRRFIERLVQRDIPTRVFVVPLEPPAGPLDPGPLRAHPEWLCVLDPRQLEVQLARLT